MPVDIEVQKSWSVPLANNNFLEYHRLVCHFRERRAGREAEAVQDVRLPQPAGGGLRLLQADAYMSGFDTWYTRDHSDHELMRLNFDALAVQVYQLERMVQLRLRFQLTDEDTNDDDDFNEAWLGLVVVAHSAN